MFVFTNCLVDVPSCGSLSNSAGKTLRYGFSSFDSLLPRLFESTYFFNKNHVSLGRAGSVHPSNKPKSQLKDGKRFDL